MRKAAGGADLGITVGEEGVTFNYLFIHSATTYWAWQCARAGSRKHVMSDIVLQLITLTAHWDEEP